MNSEEPTAQDSSPTPSDVLEAFIGWLRGFHLDRERSKAADWFMVGLTGVGLVAAIASAIFLYLQLRDAQNNFMLDERAVVVLNPISPPTIFTDKPSGTQTFEYNLQLKNVGKTTATGTKLHVELVALPVEFAIDDSGIKRRQDHLASEDKDPDNQAIFRTNTGKSLESQFQSVIAPNTDGVPQTVSAENPSRWKSTPESNADSSKTLFMIGHVDYDDQFKVHHWLRFCYQVREAFKGPTLDMCGFGNSIDDNAEVVPATR